MQNQGNKKYIFKQKKAWLHLYNKFSNTSVLNNPDFIEIICQVYRCESEHQILLGEKGSFGVPCYKINTPIYGKKITSNPFNFYPPILGNGNDVDAIQALIKKTRQFGSNYYLEYKTFNQLPTEVEYHLNLNRIEPSVVSQLLLLSNIDLQRSKYRRSLRQNLRTTSRRAKESGITFDWADDIADLYIWYTLMVRLYKIKHQMICQPWNLFKSMHNYQFGRLLAAYKDKKLIGGVFILISPERWDYSWAAYNLTYSNYGLNTLLVDNAINRAIDAGIKLFDFGSSSPSDNDLIYFKSRWGCNVSTIKYYYWNRLPKPFDLNNSFDLSRRVIKIFPVNLLKKVPNVLVPMLA